MAWFWNDLLEFFLGCRPAEVWYTTNVLIPLKLKAAISTRIWMFCFNCEGFAKWAKRCFLQNFGAWETGRPNLLTQKVWASFTPKGAARDAGLCPCTAVCRWRGKWDHSQTDWSTAKMTVMSGETALKLTKNIPTWCRRCFQWCFIFKPKREHWSNLTGAFFFKMAWFNHQLEIQGPNFVWIPFFRVCTPFDSNHRCCMVFFVDVVFTRSYV